MPLPRFLLRRPAHINPTLPPARQRLLRRHFQIVRIHRPLNRIWRRVDRNLLLLIPELGLPAPDLVMHPRRLMAQLHVLLTQLQQCVDEFPGLVKLAAGPNSALRVCKVTDASVDRWRAPSRLEN